jgi:hypothetical protein
MSLAADAVIGKYIALRDKRTALKKAYTEEDAPYKTAMEKCEVWLLQQCNALGVDNLAVKGVGTAMKGAGKDWLAFNAWARENNEMDMFERRIARTVLTSYMKDHEGAVPPGLDVIYEQVVTVRRATKEKEE